MEWRALFSDKLKPKQSWIWTNEWVSNKKHGIKTNKNMGYVSTNSLVSSDKHGDKTKRSWDVRWEKFCSSLADLNDYHWTTSKEILLNMMWLAVLQLSPSKMDLMQPFACTVGGYFLGVPFWDCRGEEPNTIYFGGYDCNSFPSNHTAWIWKCSPA